MSKSVIRDISLGDFSAEDDNKLGEYFLDTTNAYISATDFSDNRYILLGRTGSGKSAILSYIKEERGNDKKHLCVLIKPDKSYLDAVIKTDSFYELKQADNVQGILYKLIWQYVIIVAVLKEKYGPEGPLNKRALLHGDGLKAYRFLKRVDQLSKENLTFTDTLCQLVDEINISIKGFSVKGEKIKESSRDMMVSLIRDTNNFHDNHFWDIVGGDKLYLLFDDLDIGWNPDSEDQQLLLRGLFEVMKDYAYRERVKPLIAVRTNILDELKLPQLEKYESNILLIRWTKPLLKKMLLLRFRKYGIVSATDGLDKVFQVNSGCDSGVYGERSEYNDPLDYMIDRTLYRPRDILAFCKYAISTAHQKGAGKIKFEHVYAAEITYSKRRLTALSDEWRYMYPNLDFLIRLLVRITQGYFILKRAFSSSSPCPALR